jgi:protein gp37
MKYWTHSHNAVYGCTKCSPGCSRCWALGMAQRMHDNPKARHLVESVLTPDGGWSGVVRCHEDRLSMRELEGARHRPVVAVDWMGDLFHESVPEDFAVRRILEADRVARVRRAAGRDPIHFLFLTKRYDRLVRLVLKAAESTASGMLESCAFGASVCVARELAAATDAYIGLRGVGTRWLSMEPLLTHPMMGIIAGRSPWDWVVLGGQSNGVKLDEGHALSVRDWCIDHEVPLLFKQWGGGAGVRAEHSDEPGKPPTLRGETFLDLPHGAMLAYVPGKGWRWR